MSEIKKKKITIPTYRVGEPEPLPLYFEKRPYQGASGRIYPIPYVSSLSDDKRITTTTATFLKTNTYARFYCPNSGEKCIARSIKPTGTTLYITTKL